RHIRVGVELRAIDREKAGCRDGERRTAAGASVRDGSRPENSVCAIEREARRSPVTATDREISGNTGVQRAIGTCESQIVAAARPDTRPPRDREMATPPERPGAKARPTGSVEREIAPAIQPGVRVRERSLDVGAADRKIARRAGGTSQLDAPISGNSEV